MADSFRYLHSALDVASALELPEWEAFRGERSGEPDVTIVLADDPLPDVGEFKLMVEGDQLRFAVPGIGGWEIAAGQRIALHPGLASDPRELRLFTLGSAWGALGYQRGHAMWHGSAVARRGQAVLFCGATGQGKSTLAAAVLAQGGVLVADDLSRVEPGAEGSLIHPSSARIKLWREAIEQLGWQDRILQRDYFREDKFHCWVERNAAGNLPVPLAAVVVLEEGAEVALIRLRGGEALRALMAGTIYRSEMIDAMGCWGEQAALAAQIVSTTPIYRLIRPRDFGAMMQALEVLDPLWGAPD